MKSFLTLSIFCILSGISKAQNTFPSSGNVGIGTTSPSGALTIVRGGTNAGNDYPMLNIATNTAGNIYGPIIYLNGGSGTGGKSWGLVSSGALDAAATGAAGNFAIYDATAGSRFVINNQGSIGIGTNSPSSYFHGGNNRVLEIYNPNTTPNSQSHLILSTGSVSPSSSAGSITWIAKNASVTQGIAYIGGITDGDATNFASGNLIFGTSSGTGAGISEKLRLTSYGNLGLGLTTPFYKFNVAQDITMNTDIDVAQFGISGSTDNAKRIVVGYDVNGAGFGFIKAGWYQHQWTNLSLQPQGGNVGIGTTQPDQKLTVNGTIHSSAMKVDLTIPGPDYVFAKNYDLPELRMVKNYININHHLPEIPSAAQMENSGVDLGEMNIKLLKKVEELTLYLIEKDKKDREQSKKIKSLETKISTLVKKYRTLD